jgi:hypothetical protein
MEGISDGSETKVDRIRFKVKPALAAVFGDGTTNGWPSNSTCNRCRAKRSEFAKLDFHAYYNCGQVRNIIYITRVGGYLILPACIVGNQLPPPQNWGN